MPGLTKMIETVMPGLTKMIETVMPGLTKIIETVMPGLTKMIMAPCRNTPASFVLGLCITNPLKETCDERSQQQNLDRQSAVQPHAVRIISQADGCGAGSGCATGACGS